ncbi:MAG: STAS domain-containing protein [Cyanophyceae cyanobacterium]
MKIEAENYWIEYNPATATASFAGTLRLNGMVGYGPIVRLLNDIIDQTPPQVTLDIQNLQFLNSSGINVLSKFVIQARQKQLSLLVKGSQSISWQKKLLKNLQRLMPALQVEFT